MTFLARLTSCQSDSASCVRRATKPKQSGSVEVVTPRQKEQFDKAQLERNQVRDWLLMLMARSSAKPATKAQLWAIAKAKFGVSKNSFDGGWNIAIIELGNEHWWKPHPRAGRNAKIVCH